MGLFRAYGSFCVGFGLYGFSRGLRVDGYQKNRDYDFIYKAMINGIYYALPPWQFMYIKTLLERIELAKLENTNNVYKERFYRHTSRVYKESNGICWDTL